MFHYKASSLRNKVLLRKNEIYTLYVREHSALYIFLNFDFRNFLFYFISMAFDNFLVHTIIGRIKLSKMIE